MGVGRDDGRPGAVLKGRRMFLSYIVALVLSAHLSFMGGAPKLHVLDAGGGPMATSSSSSQTSSLSHSRMHTSDAGGGPMNGGGSGNGSNGS